MVAEQMLLETAGRIFADHCDKATLDAAEQGEYPAQLHATLADNGFMELARRDSGFALADAFAVLRVAGRFAAPAPLAELMLANRWLDQSERFATVGCQAGEVVADAPWARRAELVVGIPAAGNELLVQSEPRAQHNTNFAGESRDRVVLVEPQRVECGEPAYELLALARVMQTVGSLERILELCLAYANEREQFGRPIAKFQAVQHSLAVLAAEVAAAGRAGDSAAAALASDRWRWDLAAAKARVGEAAGVVAELAHQVHGAMGFTHEHQLHHFTRRAWAWRDEFGNEAYWRQALGDHIAALGADAAWGFVATRG